LDTTRSWEQQQQQQQQQQQLENQLDIAKLEQYQETDPFKGRFWPNTRLPQSEYY
jgi:hypothetical protein